MSFKSSPAPLKPRGLRWESPNPAEGRIREGSRINLIAEVPGAPQGCTVVFLVHDGERLVGQSKAAVRNGLASAAWLARLSPGSGASSLTLTAHLGMDGTHSPDSIRIPVIPDPDCRIVELRLKTEEGPIANTSLQILSGGNILCSEETDAQGCCSVILPSDRTEFLASFRWEYQDYSIPLKSASGG